MSVDEMKCHLSLLRAPRAGGGQWRWLPGGGDTELAPEAATGRRGKGRGPGGSALPWGHVTTCGRFVGQGFPIPRLYTHLERPSLGSLGREGELLHPVIMLG